MTYTGYTNMLKSLLHIHKPTDKLMSDTADLS